MTACSTDPTYLSTACHHYQSTVELLLDSAAFQSFPSIPSQALRDFSEIYGHGAFVCRYLHCSKETRGFDSSKQRDAHEATHERKFRCADPSCFSSAGFATKSALKKHNDKWHPVVNASDRLSETIGRALAKQNMPLNGLGNDRTSISANSPVSHVQMLEMQENPIHQEQQRQYSTQGPIATAYPMPTSQFYAEMSPQQQEHQQKQQQATPATPQVYAGMLEGQWEQQQAAAWAQAANNTVANAGNVTGNKGHDAHGGPDFRAQDTNLFHRPSNSTATIFLNMGTEQQQRLAMSPPDILNEVVNKWYEQRQQEIASSLQARRPQISMQQAPGQVQPGPQITQPGQFNALNSGNQLMIPNPGQRTPQNIAAGMQLTDEISKQQQEAQVLSQHAQEPKDATVPEKSLPSSNDGSWARTMKDLQEAFQRYQQQEHDSYTLLRFIGLSDTQLQMIVFEFAELAKIRILSSVNPEQQNKLASLPPRKLGEVTKIWVQTLQRSAFNNPSEHFKRIIDAQFLTEEWWTTTLKHVDNFDNNLFDERFFGEFGDKSEPTVLNKDSGPVTGSSGRVEGEGNSGGVIEANSFDGFFG